MSEYIKTCSTCGETKPASQFQSCKRTEDGLSYSCKKCRNKRLKDWRENNPNKQQEYYIEHKEKIMERNLSWRKKNPERVREIGRRANAKKDKAKRNEMLKIKRSQNPSMRVNASIGSLVRRSLRDGKGGRSWESLVGYSVEALMLHLESQFKPGMTWSNYGEWHIDHIIPLSIFNITDYKCKGFKEAWSLTNLRPLWARDNMTKHSKLFAA